MLKTFALIATVVAFAATPALAASTGPYKLDDKGKCHASDGKFAKAELCKPAPKHCRDIKTKKFAKCDAPGTEPVPAH